jgi:hypothetical protein
VPFFCSSYYGYVGQDPVQSLLRPRYHQFIGEGNVVNYLAKQRDNEYAVTGNPDVLIRFHRIRRGRVVRRRRQSPGRRSGATGRPAAKALPIIDPDHTEPIHLVNQRRRMWIMAGSNRKWLRECTTDTHKLSASMERSSVR